MYGGTLSIAPVCAAMRKDSTCAAWLWRQPIYSFCLRKRRFPEYRQCLKVAVRTMANGCDGCRSSTTSRCKSPELYIFCKKSITFAKSILLLAVIETYREPTVSQIWRYRSGTLLHTKDAVLLAIDRCLECIGTSHNAVTVDHWTAREEQPLNGRSSWSSILASHKSSWIREYTQAFVHKG